MHHLCTVEVKVNYLRKPYIITMGTLQMAFLMPFNNADVISFNDLVAATTVSDPRVIDASSVRQCDAAFVKKCLMLLLSLLMKLCLFSCHIWCHLCQCHLYNLCGRLDCPYHLMVLRF